MFERLLRSFTKNLLKIVSPYLSPHFRHPTGFLGRYIAGTFFVAFNSVAESLAVSKLKLKPDDKVLEIGFGPGVGLKECCDVVKEGNGKVYGLDKSLEMVTMASQRLSSEIKERILKVKVGDVQSKKGIPFKEQFDAVYHVNCFFFWEDMDSAVRNLHACMKPGGKIVTVLANDAEKIRETFPSFPGDTDPRRYMNACKDHGFSHVRKHHASDERHIVISATRN